MKQLFLYFSTSFEILSNLSKRCNIGITPFSINTSASFSQITVSIFDAKKGNFIFNPFTNIVEQSGIVLDETLLYCGTNATSSNVNASIIYKNLFFIFKNKFLSTNIQKTINKIYCKIKNIILTIYVIIIKF